MLSALLAAAESEEAINPLIPEFYDILWSSVIFVALIIVVGVVVVPRLNTALDARKDAIEGGLQRAEAAQAEAASSRDEYQRQLADARAEAAKIRDQARVDGQKIVAEHREQAVAEAARVTAAAQAQIEAERSAALASLRSEVGTLAIDLASGVIGESLSDDKKATALVDRFLADLEASEGSKAGA